jgi:hypothetical protein
MLGARFSRLESAPAIKRQLLACNFGRAKVRKSSGKLISLTIKFVFK